MIPSYESTDDPDFHEQYPAPNKGLDVKKIIVTGAVVAATITAYQYGHLQGYQQGQQQEIEDLKCSD